MLAAGAVLAGCNKASENVPQEETKMIAKSFAVSMNETKTTLGDGLAVNWSKGDQIKVIAVLSDSEQESYVFDLQSGEGKASAVFSGEIAEKYAESEFYAFYTATYDAKVSGVTLSVTGYASHNVEAVEGNFDASRALLFAKVAENEIAFNHGVAYFKIQIGYEDVKSVRFTCMKGGNERIYGNPVYSFDPEVGLTKSSTIANGGDGETINYVILAKEDGATLVKDAVYYVPVTAKASTFGNLQLTYTYADGTSATKTAAMTDEKSKDLKMLLGKVYDLGNPPVAPVVRGEEAAKYTLYVDDNQSIKTTGGDYFTYSKNIANFSNPGVESYNGPFNISDTEYKYGLKMDSNGFVTFTTSDTYNTSVQFYFACRKETDASGAKMQLTKSTSFTTYDAPFTTYADSGVISLEKGTEYTIQRNNKECGLILVIVTENE